MDKIIPFNKGIHRQPSVGVDGELSELVNLVPVNGELKNVRGMEAFAEKKEVADATLMCVHKTFYAEVYVFCKSDKRTLLFYTVEDGKLKPFANKEIYIKDDIVKAIAIGNTIALACKEGDSFLLYKNGEYRDLGSGYPELPISFYLETSMDVLGPCPITGTMVPDNNGYDGRVDVYDVGEESVLVDSIHGKYTFDITTGMESVIKGIKERVAELKKEGYFMYPFFVRYAFKTFNEKYVRVSAPVLMLCTTGSLSYLLSGYKVGNGYANNSIVDWRDDNASVALFKHHLKAILQKDIDLTLWLDIIKSVDIFITESITTSLEEIPEKSTHLSKIQNGPICVCGTGKSSGGVEIKSKIDKYKLFDNNKDGNAGNYVFWEAPAISSNDFSDAIKAATTVSYEEDEEGKITAIPCYRLIASIKLEDFPTKEKATIQIDTAGKLETISSNKALITEEDKNIYSSSNMIMYNKRLIKVGNIKRTFDGYALNNMLPYMNGYASDVSKDFVESNYYHVVLEKDGTEVIVGGDANKSDMHFIYGNGVYYFYYPDSDAKRVVFMVSKEKGGEPYNISIELTQCKDDGFSYCFLGGNNILTKGVNVSEVNVENNITGDRDSIRYTDVNSPFDNDKTRVVEDVNFGQILNISNSAKAVSQGQFGAFPLYAFCEDGIWALTLSDSGEINGKQPISRDVCNNPDSVTQIDDAVVFTTDKGLMLIQGSDVVCLSEGMNGLNTDERVYFPEGFFSRYGEEDFEGIIKTENRDFREILNSCRISYDYVNQLLRIYPKEDKGKYYVFSMQSREWASVITEGEVKAVVADYPSSIVQIGDKLYRPSERDDNSNVKLGILLTRPIMLDEPFALKKLQDMRLYYSKFDGTSKCKVIVYASNDGTNWGMVNSLRKRAFKYYRFAVITKMKDMDALSGMVLRYEIERNNKLR